MIPITVSLVASYLFIAPIAIRPQAAYAYVAAAVAGGSVVFYLVLHFKIYLPGYGQLRVYVC